MQKCLGRLVGAALLLTGVAARATELEATTPHFVIVGDTSRQEITRFARRLEATHWLMKAATGVTQERPGPRVRIYLVPNRTSVARAMGQRNAGDIVGFYNSSTDGSFAVVPLDEGDFSATVLLHEYAHHFMLQHMNGAYPAWYVEGFAELMSTAKMRNEREITYGEAARHRGPELQYAQWTPIERLINPDQRGSSQDFEAAYGQYWLLTHYLTFDPSRRGQLRQYINAISSGRSVAEAQNVFTGGLTKLDRDLRNYLRSNSFAYTLAPVPDGAIADPAIRDLRPGEVAILTDELLSRRGMSAEEHLPFVARVAEVARRYPDDPAVLLLQARLLRWADRHAEALAVATRLTTLSPNDVEALALRATLMLELASANGGTVAAATLAEARSLIGRANRADPDHPAPLIAYFRSFAMARQTPSTLAIEGLYKASRMMPQESSLNRQLIDALLATRDVAAARPLLTRTAWAPHASWHRSYAAHLLGWIDGGAQGEVPFEAARQAADAAMTPARRAPAQPRGS